MIRSFGKIFPGFLLFVFFVGCAGLHPPSSKSLPMEPSAVPETELSILSMPRVEPGVPGDDLPENVSAAADLSAKEPSTQGDPPLSRTHDPGESKSSVDEVKTGMIFAKTAFEGVVKASYVRLSIVDQSDHQRTHQLVIGDEARQQNFPWEVQKVQSGYFFIELPVGLYRIQSISIPVGTTVATEPMDIAFHVRPNKVIYIGTLNVVGTKEKIKIGGMPVIQPGFEYRVDLIDERDQAIHELHQRFPKKSDKIEVHLMQINQHSNTESQNK
jgi:hypothetical protein